MTTPCRLTASVTLGQGQTGLADTGAMSVPFREMFEIHEIDWTLTALQDHENQSFDLGSIIRTRLSMGRVEITRNRSNGFVPIWNFAVPVALREGNRDILLDYSTSNYRWRLPVPLIVPRGQALVSQFSRDVDGLLSANVKIVVSYAGRYLPTAMNRPAQIRVPFVSYYEVPNTAAAAISDSQDLVNPFDVPLHVQRLLCRVRQRKTLSGATFLWDALGQDTVDPPASITIQNSQGKAVVNNPLATNIPLLFPIQRRSWTFGCELKPRERFIIRVANNDGSQGNQDIMLSMIGHREERFR